MGIVVESRKRFGKLCVEYSLKSTLLENKMLNNRLETISNYHFKPKQAVPSVDYDENIKEVEEFLREIEKKQKYVDDVKKKVSNTTKVVEQLQRDNLAIRARQPLTAEVMLARAKRVDNENKISRK